MYMYMYMYMYTLYIPMYFALPQLFHWPISLLVPCWFDRTFERPFEMLDGTCLWPAGRYCQNTAHPQSQIPSTRYMYSPPKKKPTTLWNTESVTILVF